jgi:AmmeMemoRadiSam system protein A
MSSAQLSLDTRQWLLAFARRTIASAIGGVGLPEPPQPLPGGVETLRGCFVSLHTRRGALRGCIGTFAETRPLWQTVQEMAVAAATRDPRFARLSAGELDDCVLEISALTPCQPARAEEVVVGEHGICVKRGMHQGVLLPQVAVDQGWDRETFLDQTCVKASLSPHAWRDGSVRIETFAAEVFVES